MNIAPMVQVKMFDEFFDHWELKFAYLEGIKLLRILKERVDLFNLIYFFLVLDQLVDLFVSLCLCLRSEPYILWICWILKLFKAVKAVGFADIEEYILARCLLLMHKLIDIFQSLLCSLHKLNLLLVGFNIFDPKPFLNAWAVFLLPWFCDC